MTDIIKDTFAEMGINGFRPLRDLILIRSNPMPVKTGSILLPLRQTTFYGELPNLVIVTAIVIAAGPKATVVPGDQIAFMRLNFIRWDYMQDRTVLGLIQEANIFGWADLDPGDEFADLRVQFTRQRR